MLAALPICHLLMPSASLTLLDYYYLYAYGVSEFNGMRLHHSPDASTFPGFKLTCFVYIKCYWQELTALAFNWDTSTYDASPFVSKIKQK
jgi:hypothetical protein